MDLSTLYVAICKLPGIEARLNRIEQKIDRLMKSIPVRQVVTIEDIMVELDVGRDYLRARPWMLPNFGIPDISGRQRRWLVETWTAWKKSDFDFHEQSWLGMAEDERRRIIGVAQ